MVGNRKQFCKYGHDTRIVGRTGGCCNQCVKDKHRKDPAKDSRLKPVCKNGHDILVVGRNKYGRCNECYPEEINKVMSPRRRQFCPRGHDTFICGRNSQRRCRQCMRPGGKRGPAVKQFCLRGHDISVMGRGKDRICRACKVEIMKEWKETHKEERRIYSRKYAAEHPAMVDANRLRQETNRNLRIPQWADWENINNFINNKPEGMTTDHYIPLQGDEVSGLHVSWNLQYMPKSLNSSKNNRCDVKEISKWYGKILQQAGLK